MARTHRHHIITRAHCKRYGIETDHPNNVIDVEPVRHFQHHRALPKLSVNDLPAESVEWIEGLKMGWYLARYYDDYQEATNA